MISLEKTWPVLFTAILILTLNTPSSAQIYIDTGHPDVEKMKEKEDDVKIYEEGEEDSQEEMEDDKLKQESEQKAVQPEMKQSDKPKAVQAESSPKTTERLTAAVDDLPPNAEKGKCYARCYIPDQYKYVDEMVIDKPVTFKTQNIPARYSTAYDTVMVKPETKRTETVPAEYEYMTEEIMIEPSSTQWVKKLGDPSCLSADPEDCQVMCLVEVPAKYKTVRRRIMKTPAYTRELTIPGEYKIVSKNVMVEPAKTVQTEIPATYKKMLKKVKVKDGGYQEWREVLCGDQLTSSKIREIQLALKSKGYDPGPIDNILGPQTRAALTNYQEDKGLPVGNLNMETMRSLGVE